MVSCIICHCNKCKYHRFYHDIVYLKHRVDCYIERHNIYMWRTKVTNRHIILSELETTQINSPD